jgi:hypothetical protein
MSDDDEPPEQRALDSFLQRRLDTAKDAYREMLNRI